MKADELVKPLRAIVGSNYVSATDMDRDIYRRILLISEFIPERPDIVVLPGSTEEVSKILAWANENQVPVVTKGQGEMLLGPAVPRKGGIMLHLARMNKILEINRDNMVAVVEGGCSMYGLFNQLDRLGLRFPCSAVFSSGPTAASTVAVNSNGVFGSRYGPFGDQVMGLEVVLASGEVVTLGTGAAPGYGHWFKYIGAPNPTGLFIQSMGTLGVITKIAWRIVPKPRFETTISFAWSTDRLEDASRAFYELQNYSTYNIDVWNHWCFWDPIKVGKLPPFPAEVEILGLFIQDGYSETELRAKEKDTKDICTSYRGIDLTGQGYVEEALGPPNYMYWSHDTPIQTHAFREKKSKRAFSYYHHPIIKFDEHYELWRRILEKYGFWNESGIPRYRAFAEMPAALSPYPGWMYGEEDKDKVWEALKEWHAELIKRGAMPYIMGPLWPREALERLGPQYKLMQTIKRCMDPNNILNPGQLF